MKINEVEKKTGLSRQTIYWYEKEGLIQFERSKNGYRNFTEKEVDALRYIRALRDMDFSIDEIRHILEKKIDIQTALENESVYLKKEQEKIDNALNKVTFFNETKAPINEQTYELNRSKRQFLPKKASLKPYTIGLLQPTKKSLAFLIGLNGLLWILLAAFVIAWTKTFLDEQPLMAIASWMIALLIVLFGIGHPAFGILTALERYSQSICFEREGMKVIAPRTLLEKIKVWVQPKPAFIPYSEIASVKVIHSLKQSGVGVGISYPLITTSFYFDLLNGQTLRFLDQLFFERDEQAILTILEGQKIKVSTQDSYLLKSQNATYLTDEIIQSIQKK